MKMAIGLKSVQMTSRKVGEAGMTEFIITCQSELQKDGSYKIERYRELVRCKDCHFAVKHNANVIRCLKDREYGTGELEFHGLNWFCADGERG